MVGVWGVVWWVRSVGSGLGRGVMGVALAAGESASVGVVDVDALVAQVDVMSASLVSVSSRDGGGDCLTTFGRLFAFASVMTWSGWSPDFTGTRSGSELVAALESAYASVRRSFPELPDVVIITGSGETAFGLTWGHFAPERWNDALAAGRVPEMFLGAELLAAGARRT